MANKVAVAAIHGIGSQQPGWSKEFEGLLRAEVSKRGGPDILFREITWQSQIESHQMQLLDGFTGLSWNRSRRFFTTYAGDALAYQPVRTGVCAYSTIHHEVEKGLKWLWRHAPQDDVPFVLVAHSLGTIIACNYLWDCIEDDSGGHRAYRPTNISRAMVRRMRLFYTLGSPLAVWSLRYAEGGAPVPLPDECRWRNIYSPADVIGYPIKGINDAYASDQKISDECVRVGGLLTCWNPASHVCYMDDRRLVRRLADDIAGL